MDIPIVKSFVDDGRHAPTPCATTTVYCYHGDDPRRASYGQVMYDAFSIHRQAPGLIWVESDIAIEPLHISEIGALVELNPRRVVAVPFRLYPASTHQDMVMWPFYVATPGGGERILEAWEEIPLQVRSFGLGCTYLPARLFHLLGNQLSDWDWPSLDWRLSVAARDAAIEIVTTKTPAVHLHY